MEFPDHCIRSMAALQQVCPEFVAREDPELLALLNSEIHRWFDFFIMNKFWQELYGYVDAAVMKHRLQRHHHEGIIACVYVFTKDYGEKYREIIQLLAECHVYDDWGEIPFMYDYNADFWKRKRGW